MAYLRYRDYIPKIQDKNLQQIITSDDSIRLISEAEAEAEVISYLPTKYDVSKEFTDTLPWSPTKIYKGNDRVELNYPLYDETATYVANDLVVEAGKAYISISGNSPGTFNPAQWTLLGNQYDLFFITLPAEPFDYKKYYLKDDQVFWKDKVYTALLSSPILDHETAIQYTSIAALPYPNVFPDDPIEGARYWSGVSYSVPAGTIPTDATKWTKGDNRSIQIVQKMVDICLYHLHARIAPRNIPQLRIDRYNAAIDWLNMVIKGDLVADIPLLQPKTDGRIRFGGNVRIQNEY